MHDIASVVEENAAAVEETAAAAEQQSMLVNLAGRRIVVDAAVPFSGMMPGPNR